CYIFGRRRKGTYLCINLKIINNMEKISNLDYYNQFLFFNEQKAILYSSTDISKIIKIKSDNGESHLQFYTGQIIEFPDSRKFKVSKVGIDLVKDKVNKHTFEDMPGENRGVAKKSLLTINITLSNI